MDKAKTFFNLSKKELSWTMYDFANSAFATVVMAGFFPIFFKTQFASENSNTLSTFYLGLGNSLISLLIATSFPFLGAISDLKIKKKTFLFILEMAGVLATCFLYFITQNWLLTLILYITGSIGFFGANVFYDAMLKEVTTEKRFDIVSSMGFALGYLGGGLLFLFSILLYHNPAVDKIFAMKISFVMVGLWWLIFSLPLLFQKEERKTHIYFSGSIIKEVFSIFKNFKAHRKIILFLIAYWCYIDGVDTIIKMSVDYGVSLGFSSASLIIALLMVQFLGFPFAILYGGLAKKIGTKNSILVAICGYITITTFGMLMTKELHFFILAFMVSIFQGGIQALSRSYFATLIPENESGKFFGFYNLAGKFATIFGPFMVGFFTLITKNHRVGIASIILLFLIGGIVILAETKSQ
ncbi:MAG: MFS transporter [Brevinematia bacterium]